MTCVQAGQCASGYCVAGYCCNTACDSPCLACDLPGRMGTCSPVSAGTCSTQKCSGGEIIDPGTCEAGVCKIPNPRRCPNNLECSGSSCKTSCVANEDCFGDFMCLAGACADLKVDQEQLVVGGTGVLGGPNVMERYAETVTAGMTGTLVEVRLLVGCSPPGTVSIQIQSVDATTGAPDGNILSTVTVPVDAVPLGFSLRSIPLTKPIRLTAGTMFAIVVTGPQTDGCAVGHGSSGDTYPRGRSFFDGHWEGQTSSGWMEQTSDMPFQTVMAP